MFLNIYIFVCFIFSSVFLNMFLKMPIYASTFFFSFFFFKNDGVRNPFFFFLSFLGEPSVETSYETEINRNLVLIISY